MTQRNVIGLSDDIVVSPEGLRITLVTEEGPLSVELPLLLAEKLLLNLRAAADDAHRIRIEQGNPLGRAVTSADKPPLDTAGCMATMARDGRILLQFRHAAAKTTSLFVPRVGAAMLARALTDLSGPGQDRRAEGKPGTGEGRKATRDA
jgi:hypothetical protein